MAGPWSRETQAPSVGEFGSTLAAFSTVALAFIVRPIGAAIFGHMGDRLGRRATLLWTVGIMGVATGLIGLIVIFPLLGHATWHAYRAVR